MTQPLAIDLFCGLGGWTEGLLAEGYRVVGFDIERHHYGDHKYPAQLVIQDVLTIHGSQFKSADLIVASPPCQEYSYMAMPWSIAKQKAREYRDGTRKTSDLTALFDACFRIQREASEAKGQHIPLLVENVRGAQEWVGRSRFHFGSFHLWGDVPALMPFSRFRSKAPRPGTGNQLVAIRQDQFRDEGVKAGDRNKGRANGEHKWTTGFDVHLSEGAKMSIGAATRSSKGRSAALGNYDQLREGLKQGGDWFNKASGNSISRRCSSRSKARKHASALIAKIPLVLSRHIANVYKPEVTE